MASTPIARVQKAAEHNSVSMQAIVLYGCTSFLSALLLFQVQLIVSKYILPWFGGSAAVWTTSMLVFQILLLGGYVYSHLVSERLSRRAQSNVHLALLAAAFLLVLVLSLAWPSAITPGSTWKPLTTANPVWSVTVILLLSAGLPFFVLSTTGPLLQRWFALQGGSAQTYRLYAVSNLGSLLGLLTFPFLLEPTLHMTTQGRLWAFLFCLFAAGCAWCAWGARNGCEETPTETGTTVPAENKVTASTRALWFLLAACASALLLATTNLLCQEVTSIPLLWVLPLSLYLLSFILCFDHPRWYRREIFHPLFAAGIFALYLTMHFALRTPQIVIMPVLLFVVCMICHGELVKLKPEVRRLTSFYLAISAGGAVGGIFVAVLAPQLFRFFTEFQVSLVAAIVLLLCCLFRDEHSWIYRMGFWIPSAIAAVILGAGYGAGRWIPALPPILEQYRFYPLALLVSALAVVGAYLQKAEREPAKKTFCAGQVLVLLVAVSSVVMLYQSAQAGAGLFMGKRNFYGALRIYELAQGGKALFHGQTMHGAQLNPPNDHIPMLYYGPDSGIGVMMRNHPKRGVGNGSLRIGVVGLGAGTLAAYGQPGDYFRYYEINPDVVALSYGAQPVFTYIRDSQAKVDTELGDARLLLEREASHGQTQNFDVLVLDAFSGDAIPVHLLTTEAFDTYWKQVNPDHGIIAIHVSSRHINLMPVIEGTAEYYNASKGVRFQQIDYPFLSNLWVFLARHPEDLEVSGMSYYNPPPLPHVAPRVWTDDYSDIIRLLY